ncbi:MAG: class I SAM-dependent DNA methyltransferase [Acidimicrobiia bacterium]
MDGYNEASYGDNIADLYDSLYDEMDSGPAIEVLSDLAAEGPVLELGIGTGRLALPLTRCNVEVDGIDASSEMVQSLRGKPGGNELEVTVGDFADFDLPKTYRLVFVAFNTFFSLRSQAEQVSCFKAVARHLAAGGAFVIETFVPDVARFSRQQRVKVSEIAMDKVIIDVTHHDPVSQRVVSQKVLITENGIRLLPVLARYAYPAELDLMALLAGLQLEERWGDWDRAPFSAGSDKHVSVYRPIT